MTILSDTHSETTVDDYSAPASSGSAATASIDQLGAVATGDGDHYFFLNHLASVKVRAGNSDSGLSMVEFTAPRGFGPPRHVHNEEDELLYVVDGEIRVGDPEENGPVLSAGGVASLPHGIPHTFQVVSDEATFLTISSGRRQAPSFDRFVATMGAPVDPADLPDPSPIDPGHVAKVCADHGMNVLGPPPADLD